MSLIIAPRTDSDYDEPDRTGDAPHPREMLSLVGQQAAETEFLDAYRSGRLHHAWLLGGPAGIGKATLAYRIARFVLANPDFSQPKVQTATTLDVAPDHPVVDLIAANSHPDLAVIRRVYDHERKRVPTEISVDVSRKRLEIFNKTASGGGYRICIVDACDELNGYSANALLKTLEEPPHLGLFLLVAHQPRRVLATIRSRCRSLPMRELSESEVRTITSGLPSVADEDGELHARAAALSDGSVKQALAMLDPKRLAFNDKVEAALQALPAIKPDDVDAIAELTAGKDGEAAFDRFFVLCQRWLSTQLDRRAPQGRPVYPLAELWTRLEDQRAEIRAYNLDRRPFVIATLADFAVAARSD